jgi:membrane protease subunit (stomatin/prohibitin family)
MVPLFNNDGLLPPGIHFCNWEEFVVRFGTTQHRLNLIAGLRTAMVQLRSAGCSTVYIDGSFVTHKLIPEDFDACWDENEV